MHMIDFEFDELNPFRDGDGAINCSVYGEATIVILDKDDWWIRNIHLSAHNEKIGPACKTWTTEIFANHPLFDPICVELNRSQSDKINRKINNYIEELRYAAE